MRHKIFRILNFHFGPPPKIMYLILHFSSVKTNDIPHLINVDCRKTTPRGIFHRIWTALAIAIRVCNFPKCPVTTGKFNFSASAQKVRQSVLHFCTFVLLEDCWERVFCTFACCICSRMTKKIFCSKLVKLARCRWVLSLVAIMAKWIWKYVQRISSPSFIFEFLLRAAAVSSLNNQIQKNTKNTGMNLEARAAHI